MAEGKRIKLVFYGGLILETLLVLSIELLVVLDEQRVLIAVTVLHLKEGLFLFLFPSLYESLNLCHAGRRSVVRSVEAGKGRPRRDQAGLRRVSLVANLLNICELLISVGIDTEDSL